VAAGVTTSRPTGLVAIFLAFALAYFLSALLRAITATLAPLFGSELGLGAADLGLLAGAYFLGFAAMQLPLGAALDRFGPRLTLLALLSLAVLGCLGFALADSLPALVMARALIGVGVSACLMAPLTAYRHLLAPALQMRANSWMLMSGSLGMVASTLPVQWALPLLGWRGLFCALAAALLLAMVAIAFKAPGKAPGSMPQAGAATAPGSEARAGGYRSIVRHPLFVACAPLGFFNYGGMVAIQALWAGPWLTEVGGATPSEAAGGLFVINLCMLLAFFAWGLALPRLAARGIDAPWLLRRGLLLPITILPLILALGPGAGAWHWALWCVACTFVSVSQPAVGAAFPAALAGRALSAFNLVIFAGVFAVQWGLGLSIDALRGAGVSPLQSYRWALLVFWACSLLAWLWFRSKCPPDTRASCP
jgi:MFS family permease